MSLTTYRSRPKIGGVFFCVGPKIGAVLFFLAFTLSVVGQQNFMNGYIVKKNKDSLSGQIDYRDWATSPSQIVFQSAGRSSTLGADDLLAFGVNGQRYESRTVHVSPYSTNPTDLTSQDQIGKPYDTTVFLQVLTSGKLTLWELRLTSTNYYFVTGQDGNPDQLRLITRIYQRENGLTSFEQQEAYKNQLNFLLQDCVAAAKRVSRTSYDAESLRKLIFAYDYCGKDTVDKSAATGKAKSRMFVFLGYLNSTVKFSGNPEGLQNWPASSSPTGGVGVFLPIQRSLNQFAFVLDATWQHFHSQSGAWSDGQYAAFTGSVDYNELKLDILFRYSLPTPKARPFVEMGMANGFAVGVEASETFTDSVQPSFDYANPIAGGKYRTYVPGLVAGAGVSIGRWDIEGRVETNVGISEAEGTTSKTFSWSALVMFRL